MSITFDYVQCHSPNRHSQENEESWIVSGLLFIIRKIVGTIFCSEKVDANSSESLTKKLPQASHSESGSTSSPIAEFLDAPSDSEEGSDKQATCSVSSPPSPRYDSKRDRTNPMHPVTSPQTTIISHNPSDPTKGGFTLVFHNPKTHQHRLERSRVTPHNS